MRNFQGYVEKLPLFLASEQHYLESEKGVCRKGLDCYQTLTDEIVFCGAQTVTGKGFEDFVLSKLI